MVAAAWLEGDFVLRSGRRSRYYFDKYLFETQPGILRRAGRELAALVPAGTARLAAPELGAVLLGGAVSLELDLPLVLVRKEAKGYGTSRALEGVLQAGDRVTVIEDVLTTGGAAIDAVHKLREAGAEIVHLLAVLDREESAAANLAELGIPFTPLFTRADLEAAREPRAAHRDGGA
ncbi:MAG: orotate phosphoribosyltransferase [Candidatus Nephthysia bennettiae]|uniref:Orotate phosphoribosyltransferase n=1 Tax=Candidatus Nephthysia bennettiae TaxID=3127016 RepID=A0A934N9U2_9BACT|nr:orotate phosphoribosyltransferase [Candidatus Dormibacteraeota bacterium]MBJ7614176.1 orotate phosphoribosyltransferase [Candidatus Dormibacteraeota bacterium]PZS00001.1 MAG: orotate phosphoribosyltransferase [Candidatus Dormibacteraeota bacterium]